MLALLKIAVLGVASLIVLLSSAVVVWSYVSQNDQLLSHWRFAENSMYAIEGCIAATLCMGIAASLFGRLRTRRRPDSLDAPTWRVVACFILFAIAFVQAWCAGYDSVFYDRGNWYKAASRGAPERLLSRDESAMRLRLNIRTEASLELGLGSFWILWFGNSRRRNVSLNENARAAADGSRAEDRKGKEDRT
jgi:hypothetical protein